MRKIGLFTMCLMLACQAWALTKTGMPALDELRDDVEKNGALSKKLGFSEDQREKIKDYIDDKSEELVRKRDQMVKQEQKLDRREDQKEAKREGKDEGRKDTRREDRKSTKEVRELKDDATRDLTAAREEAFAGLRNLMSEDQFKELTKWRAEGKSGAR